MVRSRTVVLILVLAFAAVAVAETGKLSFTDQGIFIGGVSDNTAQKRGTIYRYSLDSEKQWQQVFDFCGAPFVSKNGATAAGVAKSPDSDGQTNWRVTIHNLSTGILHQHL